MKTPPPGPFTGPSWPTLRGMPVLPQLQSARIAGLKRIGTPVQTRVRQAWVVEVQRPDGTWGVLRACDRKAEALAPPVFGGRS